MGASEAQLPSSTKTLQKQRLETLGASLYVLSFLFIDLTLESVRVEGNAFQLASSLLCLPPLNMSNTPKLVKTAELPPDQNYVLGAHPHGVMSTGIACNFCTECNDFSRQFPGLRCSTATLAGLFQLPVYRDYLMSLGLCPVNRQSLDFILSQPQRGQAVVILVGGAHESLYAAPGEHCLTLRNRKGFVRLALTHGASLVPVYSFGENEIFRMKTFAPDSWQRRCQTAFKELFGFSPCIFWGRSLSSANSWGLLPFARPLTTVVGSPIPVPRRFNPTKEEVDHYHTLYMEALEQLFEEHKESCGVPASTHLTFI
ncbi:2-acylglycerol O-acyltransferase 3 [Galemys pyrenaicus]|uniref:Acyltransferase n=1 Tax=Galemys pyrenaicus TaxID=202257 RepID=A0A8J5ZZB6_GALPY|nr:2-acylglycerol O-acyltransferase 3 [Galemys pyrenaicus]